MNIGLLGGILLDALFTCVLVLCSYQDMKTRSVSNALVAALLIFGVIHTIQGFYSDHGWWVPLAGMTLSLPFFWGWWRNAIGAGDVKLIMGISLYLGLWQALISFALMLPLLMIIMCWNLYKHRSANVRIPFAPVLSFGAIGSLIIPYVMSIHF